MDPAGMIEALPGVLGYLKQRGCMVFCMNFWIWFWLSMVVGFLLGWLGHARIRQHYDSTTENPPDE